MYIVQYTAAVHGAVGKGWCSVHCCTARVHGLWGSLWTLPDCKGQWAGGVLRLSHKPWRALRKAKGYNKHPFVSQYAPTVTKAPIAPLRVGTTESLTLHKTEI